MKAFSLAVVAVGLACQAFGQGWFELDNSGLTHGVGIVGQGPYSGGFNLEVWSVNAAYLDPGVLDDLNWVGDYGLLPMYGFRLEATYHGQMTNGILQLGACRIPDVVPGGSPVTVALVATLPVYSDLYGIIAFRQPTTDYTLSPQPNPSPMAWGVNQDLVLDGSLDRLPMIGMQPKDATCMLGGTVTFTVMVGSPWPFSHYWRFNGNEISPSISEYTNQSFTPHVATYSLTLSNVQLTNAGQYTFVATNLSENPFGTVTSSNAVLTVLRPSLLISCAAQGVTLSWPSWATDYALQEADGLAAPIMTWSNLALSPVRGATAIQVTLQPAASHKFYRLQRQ